MKLDIIWLKSLDPNSSIFAIKKTLRHLVNLKTIYLENTHLAASLGCNNTSVIVNFQRTKLDVSRSMPEVLIITTMRCGAI